MFRRFDVSFTLIELLVVVTLMTVAVGIVTLRLDGLTDAGRLRSTASQLAAVVRLTRADARTSGAPRAIEVAAGEDKVLVRLPRQRDGLWEWGEPVEHGIAGGARIDRVIAGDVGLPSKGNLTAVRIGPDGRHRPFAVVLTLHDRWAVVLMARSRAPKYVVLDRAPRAESYSALLLELETFRETP